MAQMADTGREELELAQKVQQRTYPSSIPLVEGYQIFGHTVPASWGNGDFFDAVGVKPRDGRPGFIIDQNSTVEHAVLTLGDATGHGMGSALMATELRATLRASIRLGVYHRDLVDVLNAQLVEDLSVSHFITLLMGRLIKAENRFRWVSFGQGPIWLYRAKTGDIETLEPHHPPLGILDDVESYTPTETDFEPGDTLIALSDGFPETMNDADCCIGDDAVRATFQAHATEAPSRIHDALWTRVEAHANGVAQRDDRTCLLIRRNSE